MMRAESCRKYPLTWEVMWGALAVLAMRKKAAVRDLKCKLSRSLSTQSHGILDPPLQNVLSDGFRSPWAGLLAPTSRL